MNLLEQKKFQKHYFFKYITYSPLRTFLFGKFIKLCGEKMISKGDFVTRKSYNNDTLFKVIKVRDGVFYLKGVDMRLMADAEEIDLIKVDEAGIDNFEEKQKKELGDRSDYFYLPAKILHIDGDSEYLNRCLKFYKNAGVMAIGKKISEEHVYEQLGDILKEYKPDIVIITGHDAYYRKKGDMTNLANYKNSANFIKAIKVARKYEKSHDKLVIIAGACQSDYEALIEAGANFASSPKRVNIHALDPAIIATSISLTPRNKEIDLLDLLDKTKYGKDGMGGIITNGLMYVGFPR